MGRLRSVLLVLLFLPLMTEAGEIVESSAALDSGVYSFGVLVRIEAPLDVVHRVITDYEHLTAINTSIVESHVVKELAADRSRVYTRVKLCVLFFCKQVVQVQDIAEYGESLIKATLLPESSDFDSGHASWDLVVADDVTYMQFDTELDPSFWVPPLIGTWLLEREMVKQVLETAAYIEQQAGQRGIQ